MNWQKHETLHKAKKKYSGQRQNKGFPIPWTELMTHTSENSTFPHTWYEHEKVRYLSIAL